MKVIKSKAGLFFAGFMLLAACKKIEQLLTFYVSNETSVTIPATTPVNLPVNVGTPDVTSNSAQQFKNNNSNINLVKDIRLDNLGMTITNPANQTFSFLKSIHLYISTDSTNEIELAWLDSIPTTASLITLQTTQSALDSYVKASSYKLRTQAVCRQVLTQNTTVDIKLKFKVTANL
jgi:hypothetical protein